MRARHVRTRRRDHVRAAARSRARIRFEEHLTDDAVPDDEAPPAGDAPAPCSDR